MIAALNAVAGQAKDVGGQPAQEAALDRAEPAALLHGVQVADVQDVDPRPAGRDGHAHAAQYRVVRLPVGGVRAKRGADGQRAGQQSGRASDNSIQMALSEVESWPGRVAAQLRKRREGIVWPGPAGGKALPNADRFAPGTRHRPRI